MKRPSQLGKRLVEFAAERYPDRERQGFIDELHDHIDSYNDEGLSSRALWVGVAQLRPSDVLRRRNWLLGLGPISLIAGPILIGRLGEDTWGELIVSWLLMLGVLAGLVASVPVAVFLSSKLVRPISPMGSSIADRWVRDIRILTGLMGASIVFSTIAVLLAMEHASWNAYFASGATSIGEGDLPESFTNGGWSGMGFVGVLAPIAVMGGLGWTMRSMGNLSGNGTRRSNEHGSVAAGWYALEASLLVGLATVLTVVGSIPMFALGGLSEMPGQAVVIPSISAAVAFLSLPVVVGVVCWLFATMRLAAAR